MLLVKTDPRVTITLADDHMHASLTIKKSKPNDEAKYICKVEGEENEQLDYAGFSVFVKGKI